MPALKKIGAAALSALGFGTGATVVTANFLVVAGGAGGGYYGGGGGAGGYRTSAGTSGGGGSAESALSLSLVTSYTVIVGAGGIAGSSGSANGGQGSNSSIGSLITSVGGGYASGNTYPTAGTGGTGGSGGGASPGSGNNNASGTGGSGTANQGYAGGAAWIGAANGYSGFGGGGGAGATGGASTTSASGAGGTGVASSISGSSVTYAGGGGGGGDTRGTTAGAGGSGGGGSGSTTAGSSGSANLGGGGGGGGYNGSALAAGAQGGSGIVIISYTGAQQFGGGVVTSAAGNTIHTFYTSGVLSPLSSLSASYLIVAGGGGGNQGYNGGSGGGGAGGMQTGSGTIIDTNSTYLVSVGAGGAAYTSGSNSSFSLVTASVGGGTGSTAGGTGATGGSGGGGSPGAITNGTGGAGTSGQGNAGGAGYTNAATIWNGGGGGGAGGAGVAATSSGGGNGGAGLANSISGTSITYAGGGAGGVASGTPGSGGSGGGGAANTSGTANTGGGGGGASTSAFTPGAGGSGIVIIAYAGSTQQMSGGTVTVSGGNVIHTFTSSGYLSPLTNFGNSLRYRSSASAYLNRTPTVASNRQTWTFSAWVKRGTLGSRQAFFCGGSNGTSTDHTYIEFSASDIITVESYASASSLFNLQTSAVYRDLAAWYHIVYVLDTTQATSSNRVKLYVNGSQVTAFGSATYPSQNYSGGVNTVSPQTVGRYSADFGPFYFDGYMTNINFIDGQALAPTSFGSFNQYGNWVPVTYGGSYGTNGFFLPFNVDRTQYSYAFNTTPSYLTSSTAGIMPLGNTTWSIECWAWFNAVPSTNVSFINNSATAGLQIFYRTAINTVEIGAYGAADVLPASVTVNNQILNAWNHFVFTSNGTQLRIFLNGVLIGYAASTYSFAASQSTVQIGTNDGSSAQTLNGFMSNLRVCNGSIPTSYQTSSTTIGAQVFTPPTTALTTTSQGAANVTLLTCQSATIVDNSSSPKTLVMTGTVTPSTIGPSSNPYYDQSPQGNNWTPNNFSLVNNSTLDSMTDVPTLSNATSSNYCVLNPLDKGSTITTYDGNLRITASGTYTSDIISGTFGVSSGKWYWEASPVNSGFAGWAAGIVDVTLSGTNYSNLATGRSYAYGGDTAQKYNGQTGTSYGATYGAGDVIGVAFDAGAGSITFYKNNTSQGVAFTGISGTFAPMILLNGVNSGQVVINFGQQPFVYTPPSGFVALNAFNM